MTRLALILAAGVLASCSGGGDGYCKGHFFRGSTMATSASCQDCNAVNQLAAIDDAAGTWSTVSISAPGGQLTYRATAPEGTTFPAGARAGALMRFPRGDGESLNLSFSLYFMDALVGGGQPAEAPAPGKTQYYAIESQAEFDAVEAVIGVNGNAETVEVQMREFCGDR